MASGTPDLQQVQKGRGEGRRSGSLVNTPRGRPAAVGSQNHRNSAVGSLQTSGNNLNKDDESQWSKVTHILKVKQLRTEQRKLQDTTLGIEKMLKEIRNMEERVVSKKSSGLYHVILVYVIYLMINANIFIQALVHDVYAQVNDNNEMEWDYNTVKFGDPKSKDINKLLMQNISAVNENGNVNVSVITVECLVNTCSFVHNCFTV